MQQAADVATALQLGVKTLQFYAADHPRVVEAMTHLEQVCGLMLAERTRVSFTAAKGMLLVDGEPFVGASAHVRALATELERRQIGGLILFAGVRRRELLELARLLSMRPEQLRTAGGAEELLQRAEVEHVRISRVRYEPVTADEEVVWSKSVRRSEAASGNPAESLPALLQQFLLQQLNKQPDKSPGNAGASVADAGPSDPGEAAASGTGSASAPDELFAALRSEDGDVDGARAEEILRTAMEGMDPVAQLALLVGVGNLPEGQLRDSFRTAAGRLLGSAPATTETGGDPDPTRVLLQAMANNDEQLSLLRERLTDMGVSREQLDELLDVLAWDRLPIDERMAKLLAGERIFDFPADKFVRFLRQLLEVGRAQDAQRLLESYVRGLTHEALFVRRTACTVLGQVVLFIKEPGLPREIEQLVGTALLNAFVLEGDSRMKSAVGESAANFIAMLMATGRNEPALRVLTRLDDAVAVSEKGATIRLAMQMLIDSFGETHRAAELIAQTSSADPDSLTRFVMPLVSRVGGAATPHFIEALGTEEDRQRRGRLVKALKAIGEPAFPHLVEALRSPTWFVVRNALNVLGDIGGMEEVEPIGRRLEHGDPRVRRAAARALSKIGGFDAETLLAGALDDRDSETQAEILLCLGSMKAQAAVPKVAELAKVRLIGTDEKVQELAIATLGQIGSDAALAVLAEVLRSKGFLGKVTPAVRAAAARAVAAINTPAARDLLKEVGAK